MMKAVSRRRRQFETLEPRRVLDGAVVFNEIMYHPPERETDLEWVELHNQNAVDIDLSRWRLAGGVEYEFPEGTLVPGGGYLVVAASPQALATDEGFTGALGPFAGRLANGGERLELRDRNDRLLDAVEYSDGGDWSAAADGAGASLAKLRRNTASEHAESWGASFQIGGTPGRANFAVRADTLVPPPLVINEVAAIADSTFVLELMNRATAPVDLAEFAMADAAGHVYALPPRELEAGGKLALQSVQLGFQPGTGDVIALRSLDGERIVDAIAVSATAQARYPDGADDWFTPAQATPGAANDVRLHDEVVINEIMYHHRPQYAVAERPPVTGHMSTLLSTHAVWKYNDSGRNLGDAWLSPEYDDSAWPAGTGMLYAPSHPQSAGGTPVALGPTTHYFRAGFQLSEDPALTSVQLRYLVDDGLIVYLNGREFRRENLADGDIAFDTPASQAVRTAAWAGFMNVPADYLVQGTNHIAVEVHQAVAQVADVAFAMEVVGGVTVVPGVSAQPYVESDEEWIELYNGSSMPVDITGWRLDDAVNFAFAPGTVLPSQGYLVVARDAAALRERLPGIAIVGDWSGGLADGGERIQLRDDRGNLADEVRYFDAGRWPAYADGGGSSLELRNPAADNSVAESWAASDEGRHSTWQRYAYRGVAQASAVGPDGMWHEFLAGLLDAGGVLLDDIQVIESPSSTRVQLIQNSDFSQGNADKWRIVGDHHGQIVLDPDNPTNPVLRLTATGTTDHNSNHAETTLKSGNTFVPIVNGREYEISFRARWLGGSPQLHTRLYFNRLPATTVLQQPERHGTPGERNSTFVDNTGPVFRALRHEPAVPNPDQPVTVTVAAADPDGVANVMLWYRVGSGAWTSSAMHAQPGGAYSAVLPPQGSGTIVAFCVEAVDGLGTSALFPANGPEGGAAYRVNDGLATQNGLHNVRIAMTPENTAKLHGALNVMSNAWLPSTVIYDEHEVFYNVGIQLKGSAHTRTSPTRLGFTVRFNADQPFRGTHETVSFDRTDGGTLGQREMLSRQMANHAGGLPTMYHDLAQLITPLMEQVGTAEMQTTRYRNEFLETQYVDGGDGLLFEYEAIYLVAPPTSDGTVEGYKIQRASGADRIVLSDLGNDADAYRWILLPKNNRDRDDFEALVDFAKTMSLTGSAFLAGIEEKLDVDQWLRAFAMSVLSGAGDNYGADGDQHNGMFYVRPADGRVLFLPNDLDLFRSAPQALVGNEHLARMLTSPEYARTYYGHLLDIISTTWNTTYMAHWATNYGRLLPSQPFTSHLAFIGEIASTTLQQLNTLVRPTPFQLTSPDVVATPTSSVTLTGAGWINVREIRLAGDSLPLNVRWRTLNSFEVTLPAPFGTHELVLEAYDFQGVRIGVDSVTVTSSFSSRPLEDFLRISEIMYHPADPAPGSPWEDDDFEFVELLNIGPANLDLAEARFIAGIEFDFAGGAITELAPQSRVLIVNNAAAFTERYGAGFVIAGEYEGKLDNAGERIRFETSTGAPILDFAYDDAWHEETDGSGRSLAIIDPTRLPVTWNDAQSWRASRRIGGSPGVEEPHVLAGDTNDDGRVDLLDLNNVRNNYGNAGLGDTDDNGVVDLQDLNAVRNNFGISAVGARLGLRQGFQTAARSSTILDSQRATVLAIASRAASRAPIERKANACASDAADVLFGLLAGNDVRNGNARFFHRHGRSSLPVAAVG